VVITLVWMIIEPPGTRYSYPDRHQVILKCNIQDMSFLFSQLYNATLILVSTVYAVKTRKIPENFNESKFIGFTMYTTCIIWLAFVPIYFGTGNAHETQITTLCVAISLSASVTLVCLYSPKVYIIVFQPDKNIRGKVYMGSTFKKQTSSAGASSVTKCEANRRDCDEFVDFFLHLAGFTDESGRSIHDAIMRSRSMTNHYWESAKQCSGEGMNLCAKNFLGENDGDREWQLQAADISDRK